MPGVFCKTRSFRSTCRCKQSRCKTRQRQQSIKLLSSPQSDVVSLQQSHVNAVNTAASKPRQLHVYPQALLVLRSTNQLCRCERLQYICASQQQTKRVLVPCRTHCTWSFVRAHFHLRMRIAHSLIALRESATTSQARSCIYSAANHFSRFRIPQPLLALLLFL